jgi:CHASE2 domain-containing sensor protein
MSFEKEPFYPETASEKIKRILPVILIAAIFTYIFVRLGFLGTIQNHGIDSYLKFRSSRSSDDIILVTISEGDYATIFQSQSPLNASQLQKLLNATVSGNPKIIGIDIDTSDPQFRMLQIPPKSPPIVWGVDAPETPGKIFPNPVLGGSDQIISKGLVLLLKDSKEVVRTYQRQYITEQGLFFSLPWAIVRNIQGGASREDGEFLLDFPVDAKDFQRTTASSVIAASQGPAWSSGILKDKIVLLGGTYAAGRDRHKTPAGEMFGMEIMAEIIQSELNGSAARKPNEFVLVLLEIFGGVIILLVFIRFVFPFSAIVSVLLIPILTIVSTYLGYHSISKWYCFIPTPIIATIYGSYNELKKYEKSRILLGLVLSPRKTIGELITRSRQMPDTDNE